MYSILCLSSLFSIMILKFIHLLDISVVHFFLLLDSIPLYRCAMLCIVKEQSSTK